MELASSPFKKENPGENRVGLTLQYDLVKRTKKHERKKRAKDDGEQSQLHTYLQKNFIPDPQMKIICKSILSQFENWMAWQKKILLCGLTGKSSRSFLQTLSTVFEPALHINSNIHSFAQRELQNNFTKKITGAVGMHHEAVSPQPDLSYSLKALSSEGFAEDVISQEIYKENNNKTGGESFLPLISNSTRNYNIQSNISCQTEQDYKSKHTHQKASSAASRETNNFFPKIMTYKTDKLGKICSIKTVVNSRTTDQTKYDIKAFKHRKWWAVSSAEHSSFAVPKRKLLMQSFRRSLDTIYMWFSKWNDAEKGDCILHLISACEVDELEYFSQCILQRLKDITDIDRLQDGLMMRIFNFLTNDELLTASEVCRRWYMLASDSRIWKKKCSELGMDNGLPDITSQIEAAANGGTVNWKLAYQDLFNNIKHRKMIYKQEHTSEDNNQPMADETDDEAYSVCSSLEESANNISSDIEESDASTDDEGEAMTNSSVSGMSGFLNGDLGMIENTVQQLSAKSQLDEAAEEETALDIRPETSVQATNKLAADRIDANSYKFVNVDGIRALKRVRRLQGHLEAVLALQFDKKRVMTGSADRTIRIWDVRSGRSVHKLRGQKGGIRALRFDNTHIITASWDMTIVVWDAVKFKRLKTLHGHQDCVSCLETTEDILVSGSHDKTLKVWCKDSWKCFRTLKGHQGGVTCLTLLGEETVLSGSSDRTIRLWSLKTFVCKKVFHGSQDVILTVQVCGDLIAGGSNDGHLMFWNLQTGQCEATIFAHNGPLHALSFYGARFVTAGGDQLVKEWDLATCCCLRSFTGHKDVVLCVQASSRRIVSGSADGTVRIWDMENRIRL